jgi:predicted nucleotidyltransferase
MNLKFLLEKLFRRKVDIVMEEALREESKQVVLKEAFSAGL